MQDDIYAEANSKMQKSVESFHNELAKVRTGRAHPSLLRDIIVTYYDQPTPISQVASITVEDSCTLVVTPWEKNMAIIIDKAIRNANLGLNPITVASVIRVPLPSLTQERRKELARQLKQIAENGRIAIRNIRRDANTKNKELLKEKLIPEDKERSAHEKIQKLTDKFIEKIDVSIVKKEADLMKI